MCTVSWCDNETKKGKNGQYLKYCDVHIQYKQYAANAPVRPWLMYKVEKIVDNEFACEMCEFEPQIQYPNETVEILASLMDVDHKDPKIKGTLEGEQPSNYQLLCKHCHILKSHREGDFINKKYKNIYKHDNN